MSTGTEINIDTDTGDKHESTTYWRFAGMIATGMLFMFVVMYVNTFQLSHVQRSETRFFMTLLMGATMAVVTTARAHRTSQRKRRGDDRGWRASMGGSALTMICVAMAVGACSTGSAEVRPSLL